MDFGPMEIELKNGRILRLRSVNGSDAETMIDYLRITASESPYLLRYPDEVNFTREGEERLLEEKRLSPKEFMMVAEVDGVLAGNCSVLSLGSMRRLSHRCEFAIALKKKYTGFGIGSIMMEHAFSLAKDMGYEQMELTVMEGNEAAMRLYERKGFRVEGRQYHAFKYDDGRYLDAFMMVKLL